MRIQPLYGYGNRNWGNAMLSIAVEYKSDKELIDALLPSAGVQDYKAYVADGHLSSPTRSKHLSRLKLSPPVIVVFDQDSGSVGDAVVENEASTDIFFCPAIPTAEAWLFADSQTLFKVVGDKAERFIGRMPLPEQLTYPNFLKSRLLQNRSTYLRLLQNINVSTAAARSPSLKYFLNSARKLSGLPPMKLETPATNSGRLNREVLRNLLSEVYPSNKPIFRSASGAVTTAEQMMQEISDGTILGKEYSSDILRVARDLLARQAKKGRGDTNSGQ